MTTRDDARAVVVDGLTAAGVAVEPAGEDRWTTMLSGEWKRTIPVYLRLDERSLHVTSLLCGPLDEGHLDVYRSLLQRNQRPSPVRFALDDEGDVVMVGDIPLVALTPEALDQLLGALVDHADTVFNRVLRAGFAGYLEAEQRWRAAHDMPPNPIAPAP